MSKIGEIMSFLVRLTTFLLPEVMPMISEIAISLSKIPSHYNRFCGAVASTFASQSKVPEFESPLYSYVFNYNLSLSRECVIAYNF